MFKQLVGGAAVAVMTAAAVGAQAPQAPQEDQVRARQRIATMEAVLAQAVSNGADNLLRQVRNVMPDQPMLAGAPRVRGFRLEGYGVFFDVEVPLLRLPIMWPLRYMVQDTQNREAARTLQQLQAEVSRLQGEDRTRLQVVVRQLEEQLGPGRARARAGESVSAATVAAGAPPAPVPAVDPGVVNDPENAYTREVKAALIDAMLENSQPLTVGADEWLVVAARDNAPRDPLIPGDSVDFSTWIFRVKGSDLAAFRAGRVTLEDARKRVELREY